LRTILLFMIVLQTCCNFMLIFLSSNCLLHIYMIIAPYKEITSIFLDTYLVRLGTYMGAIVAKQP